MKVVKGLLLSSAAGLFGVAGAQAADLPAKAKPVEYVKVCSLYGAGFFYIPGTDTCIKLGGAVRVQAEFNAGAGGVPVGIGNSTEAPQGAFTRALTNDVNFRTRIFFSVDTRQQTDYGTLRSYFRFGVNQTTPGDAGGASSTGVGYWDRAFIQFVGFTVGRTVSFFDGIPFGDFAYNSTRTSTNSGEANGITVWAYTAQLGSGISATISAEDPNGRGKLVDNADAPGWSFGVNTNANGLAANAGGNGFLFPDVVGNLRVDQAWGSAQLMAAMHDASGQYYTSGVVSSGHPSNAYGWAVGGSISVNLPQFGAQSNVNSQPNVDQFKAQVVYSEGASGYATNANNATFLANGGNHAAVGWLVDGIYSLGTDVELTTAWSAWAGYQHIWTPNWRTSVYGGYFDASYGGAATSFICGPTGVGTTFLLGGPALTGGCNPDFSVWQAGTRTQWNPVSQLDVGVDVLYSHVDTAFNGSTTTASGVFLPGQTAGNHVTFSDEGVWSVFFRVQRNFWP
jgi:hypothetical protein